MNIASDNLAAETRHQGGNELPDLNFVSQLFAALAAADSAVMPSAANDPGTAPLDEEPVPMTTDHSQSIALPSQCLLRDAVAMKSMFLERAEQDSLCIDVSALERIDAAFIQVLLALAKQRKAKGKSEIQWLGNNAVFAEAAQVLGLTRQFKVKAAA